MAPIHFPKALTDPSSHIIHLNQKLLEAIVVGDWYEYCKYASPDLTCFEPECGTHLVAGLPFHKHYFVKPTPLGVTTVAPPAPTTTMSSPHVRFMGKENDVAVLSYVRLTQSWTAVDGQWRPVTSEVSETRVWVRDHHDREKWMHVHFHRSSAKL
ncbi:hypothetical protein HDU76_010798 [Blyttiomyces sp. JEL0837]|nr:hypothetical protein HDU76_010798 [Blyttiomyces sp. JEL0837]